MAVPKNRKIPRVIALDRAGYLAFWQKIVSPVDDGFFFLGVLTLRFAIVCRLRKPRKSKRVPQSNITW